MLRFLFPAVLLIVGACASSVGGEQRSFQGSAGRVFALGYQHVRERYIDRTPMDQFALTGMNGLSEIDPAIKVQRVAGRVQLRHNDRAVAVFESPDPNDADGWAGLTTAIVAASRTYSPKLKATSAENLYKAVFDSALQRLDRYSRYSTAEQARENRAMRSGFGGIGVQIRLDEGTTKVVRVFPNTPAARGGLKAEDSILEVDGISIRGMKLRQVVKRLRGPDGSQVRLTIGRKSKPEGLVVDLVREHVIANTIISTTKNGIFHAKVLRFNQRTATDLERAIRTARRQEGDNFKGVILDLRDNPGGLLDQAVEVSDLFLTGGRIVSTEGRHPGSFQRYDAGAGDVAAGHPIVVLVNRRSASSSEIVAAALQDLNRAVLIGSNTFGKGTVQSVFRLPNDGELVLTWSRFHAPSGYSLQDLGVLPTVCTTPVGGKTPDTETLLAEVKAGEHRTAKSLALWRQQRRPTHDRLSRLRKICPGPKTAAKSDPDAKLARMLLNDKTLYASSLQLSQTSVARR